MDKRREELEELQADIHLAMLMDEHAERMGKRVRDEAEAAFEKGELEIPPELDAACRALISEASAAEAKKKPMRAITRYALVAALSIVLLFGMLIAVQAAGIDVFGSIATWTDSVFHFGNNDSMTEEKTVPTNQIQDALRDNGMPPELAPCWLPNGYEITSVNVSSSGDSRMVNSTVNNSSAEPFYIIIEQNSAEDMSTYIRIEKDAQQVETYIWNEKTYYVFTNEGSWVAVWFDGDYAIKIFGLQTKRELYTILESIGANNE
jgi:hypothetical protein